tara:strand:+ start:1007 stop:1273 length:267 start_codon:yes stop_codon:yes gene_type:complete
MQNLVTGHEYSGGNFDILCASGYDEGDLFVTFKQAIKHFGVSGKSLKGLKAAASLIRFVTKEEDGEKKKVPIPFSVFHVNDVQEKINS